MFFDPWTASDPVLEPPVSQQTIDEALFRRISASWLSGVTVVTARRDDGGLVGLTMSAISPLSLKPPQYLICIAKNSGTFSAIRESGRFCINILDESQEAVCRIFASKGADKFSQVEYEQWGQDPPELKGALAQIQCEVKALTPSGDHVVIIGNVRRAQASSGRPLGYFGAKLGPVSSDLVAERTGVPS